MRNAVKAEVSVLVVDASQRQRRKIAFWLRAAGYRVDLADSFAQARAKIDACAPTCLVTSVKLGSYNGLHLIARTRCSHPSAFVLMHDVFDPVLASEARSHDSEFLVLPCFQGELLDAIGQSLLTARKSADSGFSQRKVSAGEEFELPMKLAARSKR